MARVKTPAEIGAPTSARFGTLQRKLAKDYPHHIFAHSSVERIKPTLCRPLTEEERATPEIVAEDRGFFAAVMLWAQAGIALADLRAGTAAARQGQIGDQAASGEGEDDGIDF